MNNSKGRLRKAPRTTNAALLLALAFGLLVPDLRYGLSFFLGNAAPRFFDFGELARLVGGGASLGLGGAGVALLGSRG